MGKRKMEASPERAAKKAKTTTTKTITTTTKTTTIKTATSKTSTPKATKPKQEPTTTTAGKAARATPPRLARGGGAAPQLSRRNASPPSPQGRAPRGPMLARRSGSVAARGRILFQPDGPATGVGYGEPPPPYSEYDDDSDNGYGSRGKSYDDDGNDGNLPPLGLLNGQYDVESDEVKDQWPHYGSSFDLTLTLAGQKVWGRFDLGIIEGVFNMPKRPMCSSQERVPFTWRGREADGPIMYGNNNRGWMQFLGDGRVRGELDWMKIDFHGSRLSGQGTRSQIDARQMASEWQGFSEDSHEQENRSRWY